MRTLTRAALVAAATVALLTVAVPAFAHVTVRAETTEPEAYARYTVRVPNESETAATTTIEVQLPVEAGTYEPVPGWDISIDGDTMTISGGSIEPGQFQDFNFVAQNPAEAGLLTFPAIQTYDDGEVVRWTGAEDSDTPASIIEIGAETVAPAAAPEAAAPAQAVAPETSAPAASSNTPTMLGIGGLLAGLLGRARRRRIRARRPAATGMTTGRTRPPAGRDVRHGVRLRAG